MTRALRAAPLAAALALAACGSQPRSALPPPASPAVSSPPHAAPAGLVSSTAARPGAPATVRARPGVLARVLPRERVLRLVDAASGRTLAERPAGVGPSSVLAADGDDRVWVVDGAGNAVLQFRLAPRLSLERRVRVPGRPWAIAYDPRRQRLYVTRTAVDRLTALSTVRGGIGTRREWATLQRPTAVAIERRSGRVRVGGERAVQLIDP